MREIKNLKKAAERIKKAVEKKEKIILYGDADLDGTAAVIVLQDAIKNLGGKISAVYFPDRELEGHGITEKGLKFLAKSHKKETKKNKFSALLVALDCGVGNFKEVKMAKKLDFEVIIIDHHLILNKLPEAEIIVDPKQKGDEYLFKDLSAAGLAFKLAEALLKNKMSESLRKNFLELVALATIADMMPQKSENKIFIEQGKQSLENSWRPGIRAFLETEPLKSYSHLNQKIFKIISILNVRDVENKLPAHYRLLNSSSLEEAKKIVKKLLKKTEKRKERTEEINSEVEKRLQEKEEPIVFEGGIDFDSNLISSVASIISQKYLKPVFLYKKMAKESCGTVRSPKEINSVFLMKKCSKLLLTFGGHAQASGFRIKNENLEKFKTCLIKQLKK